MEPPPPPPPPHGDHPRPPPQHPGSGLPPGNYDIFVIPPHASGAGFLYLPSLQPHMNSFIAGCACTFVVIYIYNVSTPLLRELYGLAVGKSGGLGMVGLVLAVGVGAWAFGKTQAESKASGKTDGGAAGGGNAGASGGYQRQSHYAGGPPPTSGYQAPPPPQPETHAPPPPPPPQPEPQPQPKARPASASGWEKAREETRKREEERKRAEELKKRREEVQKAREEAERAAKAKAEQEKWEQTRAREKEKREREARERINKERLEREKIKLDAAKEAREKDAREREAREKVARDKAEWEKKRQAEKDKLPTASVRSTPTKPPITPSNKYERPTAKSAAGTEEAHSYRPYDSPTKPSTYKSTAASSISGLSESSYAPSHSTARTTPPPSQRGPYSTSDPHKIQIKAVYLFSDKSPLRPISQLVSGQGPVTDGLVLNIETEGLFIDDDVRDVAQREWDVKAWSLKLVEEGSGKNGLHLFRACSRDVDNKKYFFVLDQSEAWKVTAGVARLRKGSQVRSLGFNTIKEKEVKEVLNLVGWL